MARRDVRPEKLIETWAYYGTVIQIKSLLGMVCITFNTDYGTN